MPSKSIEERFPALAACPPALAWLGMRADLGLAPRTVDAYGRGLAEYLAFCAAQSVSVVDAGRDHVARFVRELTDRPSRRPELLPSAPSPRLANATIQQRLTVDLLRLSGERFGSYSASLSN
jgi:hypothetical protein